MNAQDLIELQNRIVVTVAKAINGDWDAAVVNIEIDDVDGEQTENCLALSFTRQRNTWNRNSFQIPFECYDLFVALRNSSGLEKWKICTLEFDYSGNYKFNYSFETPRRLNGVHDDEAMLKGYIPPSQP